MWQFTWMFNLIPDFVLSAISYLLALGGVVALVGSKFSPRFLAYRKIAELGGVVAIALGSYGIGWFACNDSWNERARALQEQVAAAEVQSKQANTQIETKGTEKVRVIKEKAVVVKQYIDREVVKYDNQCVIPDTVVKAHNAAAKNEELK
jgi:DNA-binding protein YbaB